MERYSVHLKLLGMAVLWGASWPMGRMLGQSLPPLTGVAHRVLFSTRCFKQRGALIQTEAA